MNRIYLIGSLRNPEVPKVGAYLRNLGFYVFDEWYSAGPHADDAFWAYAQSRKWDYNTALKSYAARNIYNFDRTHIDDAEIGVLLMPAGRSGHLELGFILGTGKPGYVLFDKPQERFDQMYQFTNGVFFDVEELGRALLERHA